MMPVNIKGKEYVTVAERMEGLRQSGKEFEMVESKAIALGDRVAWQVSVMIDGKLFIGSAEAHLNAKPGSADATDPFACAETSAIGRALGLAGFGSLDSIASADEIVRGEPSENGTGVPSIKELQARCAVLCGVGHWGAAVQKATKKQPPFKEYTVADREQIVKYLDFVEAQQAAKSA